jgi:allophanate hydrolase
MTVQLEVIDAGPGVSIQDQGRVGVLGFGLSRGGAADMTAHFEGAALLQQPPGFAALEMAIVGGRFRAVGGGARIALTGAKVKARIDDTPIANNETHQLLPGQTLFVVAVTQGVYCYLHVGGGIDTAMQLGSRSAHLRGGIGKPIQAGDVLPIGPDPVAHSALTLTADTRSSGGVIRAVHSMQSHKFSDPELQRFSETEFTRDTRANRMGVRLAHTGNGFASQGQLSALSEIVVPGDLQMTGDGTPYVLMAECQTTGGYPRIGTVIPCDLPHIAQADVGAKLRFQFLSLGKATEVQRTHLNNLSKLSKRVQPRIRDPHDIPDLLSYQLIDGVTTGGPDHDPS